MRTLMDPSEDLTAAELAARAARAAAEAVRAAESLQARARVAQTVSNIATAVAQRIELREMASAVLDQTVTTLGAGVAHVLLADEERRELRLLDARNLPADLAAKLARIGYDAPLISARAAATRMAQIVVSTRNLSADLALADEIAARTGVENVVSLPLVARERLIGVLTFGLTRPYAFSPQDEDALTTCGDIFAVGLANSLAYESERTLRALFEGVGAAAVSISSTEDLRATLQTIADQARMVVFAEHAVLQLEPGQGANCPPSVYSGPIADAASTAPDPWPQRVLASIPLTGELTRIDAFALAPPAAEPDALQIASVLAAQVTFHGRKTGTLYLLNKRGGPFTPEDERAIALLATFVGAALHQAQLRGEIEAQRARLEAIVTHAPHPILYVDAGTRQLVVNPRAHELLGDPELASRSPSEIGAPLESPEGDPLGDEDHPFLRALRGECVRSEELVLFAHDQKRIPCLVSAAPVSVAGSGTTGAILTFEDITALKQLERLRDEWASIVSHDLGQPLHLLSISIELLNRILARSVENVPPRVTECLQSARGAIFVLKRLAQDLTEASRLETHRLTIVRRPVDVAALTADHVERLRQMADERPIRLEAETDLPSLETDAVRLEQILGNLIQNAIKYSPAGSEVEVLLERRGGELVITVANEGPGIPSDELPHLFERFYRTRSARGGAVRGSGLGLYIVKGLAEALGGRVEVESVLGARTLFRVFLPIAPPPVEQPPPAERSAAG